MKSTINIASSPQNSAPSPVETTPRFVKILVFSFLSITLFVMFKRSPLYPKSTSQNHNLSFFNFSATAADVGPPPHSPPPPRLERTGIVNEMGIMTNDFIVGDFDEGIIKSLVMSVNGSSKENSDLGEIVKFEKFKVCDESMSEYVPCLDNGRFNSSQKLEKYERHCPEDVKLLDCRVPRPKAYKIHIPWPQSRDEVWFDNFPNTHLAEDKGGQDWILRKDDKIIFRGGDQFIDDIDRYLDQISKMVPEIAFGRRTRVALDIGAGVGNFAAYLMDRNVTTLSIAPRHVTETMLVLERGSPSMITGFGNHRLPYPSQAFDLIHCSTCGVNWTADDGVVLLEANRILRAGGYFVWTEQLKDLHQIEIEELTTNLCWELVNSEGDTAIWKKPLNNSCYLDRDPDIRPSLCGSDDNGDDIWKVNAKACITPLPEAGYGGNVTYWPARLHSPPDRLKSIQMDAAKSRASLYRADSLYRYDTVEGYVRAFHMKQWNLRTVMDMKARYGGFAAALHDFQINCWVMNVVPVSSPYTLPVIYDRGLIGVMHDWCEPFDTPPRSYDMLNAVGLFSSERKRCNITNIILEMDRMLRPGGRVYVRDTTALIYQLQEIAKAVGWVTSIFDGEGPHSNWRLMTCEKRL